MRGFVVVMKRPKKGFHYLMHDLLSVIIDKSELWHKRIGHIGNTCSTYLSDQNLLDKGFIEPLNFCENCKLGKVS